MPAKPCPLEIDAQMHESNSRGTPMFPCAGYITRVGNGPAGGIPWHWHDEIEVLTVHRGTLALELLGQTHRLREGEGAFLNAGTLHAANDTGGGACEIKSFVFQPGLISGAVGGVIEYRYLRPILDGRDALPCVLLGRRTPWHRQATDCILQAWDVFEGEPFGYEMLVREALSRLWLLIAQNHRELFCAQRISANMDAQRLQKMLTFIHESYRDRLELRDIAASAAVSERECLRCFRRTIGVTPMKYLLKHRISTAAALLANSELNITEISRETGFDSPSYFSAVFAKLVEATPKAYRSQITGGT